MRKAAGIILIVASLISLILFYSTLIRWTGPPTTLEAASATAWVLPLDAFVSLGLIMGGGICALRKRYWPWVLSGAIFAIFVGIFMSTDPVLRQGWSLLIILMGALAVVFVCLRRRDWSQSQT